MPIQENVSLLPLNTFHIEATARYFAVFSSQAELASLLEDAKRTNITQNLVLGGGSNILLTRNFEGLVLRNQVMGISIIREDDDHVYVRAGAGENWHSLVMYCVERNFGGV